MLLLYLILFPDNLIAAQEDKEQKQTNKSIIDKTHHGISVRLIAASQWFDNFFNDPRVDEEPAGTLLRLRGSATRTEGEGMSYKGRVKARLELPNLKNRYHLIFSSEDDDLKIPTKESTEAVNRVNNRQEEQTSLALQYTKRILDNFVFSHRLSIRIDKGLNPRLRTRARYIQPVTEKSLMSLTQSLFWEYEDGFGQENRIDFDYFIENNFLMRSTATGLYSEVSSGYEWLGMQQALFSFSDKRAITFGAYVRGETQPDNYLTEYVLFTEYRQNILKKWLFYEILPEIKWPREEKFSSVFAITATLEIRFGR